MNQPIAQVNVDLLEQQARGMFRLLGPRTSAAEDAQDEYGVRHCPVCTPKPVTHKCPGCDATYEHRWQLKVHLLVNPSWCAKRIDRKARAWSNN